MKFRAPRLILLLLTASVITLNALSREIPAGCSARLEKDVLTIENSLISRTYSWNNGNIITRSVTDKKAGKTWLMTGSKPDLAFPGEKAQAENPSFEVNAVPGNKVEPQRLEAVITFDLGSIRVKRVFRIYENCPFIACDLYYKGFSDKTWVNPGVNLADMANIEKLSAANAGANAPVIEKLEVQGKHWQLNAVEFFDVTDRFNNLVNSVHVLSYRPASYRGNILIALDRASSSGFVFLKEAPTSNVQLAYPGCDFIAEYGSFRITGAGLNPSDINGDEWVRGYGFATGIFSGGEKEALTALRSYQKMLRLIKPGRDEMVLMNTWGDRGQDTRVRESFALKEIETGAKLGITHFQLDDGWQSGRSSNSAFKGGSLESIWKNPDYWKPNPERFPNGLSPVVGKGKQNGVEVCLWFNPSRDNSNESWERDADALISLYNNYGIRTFKIDGVNLPDKKAETNFRKFLDKVSRETDYEVVFNLDVTAMRRGGYHYFNSYGNLFLENRYTDWQNYYPYTTLRNLWMLSKYVPAEKLQIEFLNKWRNTDKYAGDPFGPSNYSFEYLFAITMAAQPLAWFEGTGLPEEAVAEAGPVIRKYREIQPDLHSGFIFPIGQEPSGLGWTGFQSVKDGRGYFIVFRESNPGNSFVMNTWLKEGTKIKCTPLLGKGKAFTAKTGPDGSITFTLPEKNSYCLYTYTEI